MTLDEDVAEKTKKLAEKLRLSFKSVINKALRLGLEHIEKPVKQRRYSTKPHAMGLLQGYSLDNIQELLAQVEGEDFR